MSVYHKFRKKEKTKMERKFNGSFLKGTRKPPGPNPDPAVKFIGYETLVIN